MPVGVFSARLASNHSHLIQAVFSRVRGFAAGMSLRNKFLISLTFLIVAMSWGTLLTVSHSVRIHAQRQLEQDTRDSVLRFQVIAEQRRLILSRKADLLATLAFLRGGDSTTIQEASADPWQSEDCDLFALVDAKGKITDLQTRALEGASEIAGAKEMIGRLLENSDKQEWLVSGNRIYQIAVKPFYKDPPVNHVLLGQVIVGRKFDVSAVKELSRVLSSEVVFRNGQDIIVSSLDALDENEVGGALKGQRQAKWVSAGARNLYMTSLDLLPESRSNLTLIVLKSDEDTLASLAKLNLMLLGLGFIAVVAGAAVVYVISHTFTKPLSSLVEGVQALEQGDFTYPLLAAGSDELARVTRAFESMRSTLERNESQRQQLEEQLRQSQKMDALGRLAGGVAHDFNNLLTVIKGNSDLALERTKPGDPIRGNCEQICRVSDRAALLTRQLLAFSRRQVLQPKILDLNELIVEMGKMLKHLIREDIEYTVRLGDSLGRVHADPGQIEQVLMNLTVNACDAMPQGGTLAIETQNIYVDDGFAQTRPPVEPGEYVLVTVTDSGHGMDASTKARIFEPFFTTKEPGKGTGLGLATVYGVVKQSSGFVFVDSTKGKGTRFEIYLPLARGGPQEAAAGKQLAARRTRRATVLIVEDEDDVRTVICDFLKSAGYDVLIAKDGMEALEIADRLGSKIHLLLTDVVMPRMRGPELANRLKTLFPHVKVVYISGYVDDSGGAVGLAEDGSFLQKPFSRDTLLGQIDDALTGKTNRPTSKHRRQAALPSAIDS